VLIEVPKFRKMKVFLRFVRQCLLLSPVMILTDWVTLLPALAKTSEQNNPEVTAIAKSQAPNHQLPAALPDASLADAGDRFHVQPERTAELPSASSEAAPAAPTAPDASLPVAPWVDPLSPGAIEQVTSVSQLSDVQPTDWAFQALQSLVERYGVIAGYPDGTYRGDRALTRYEFAAGLNAALDRVNELIAAGLADAVTREDLATLQRLQEEFAAELATLRGRVDALEARTAELEANQFSTTTILNGETIFGLSSILAGDNARGESVDRIPTFNYRVRLNLNTSFTGEDLLTTRLQASNVEPLGGTRSTLGETDAGELGTNMGRIEYDGDSNNDVQLGLLRYRFPISDQTNIYIAATGNGFVDLDASSQLTPYLDGVAVSLFGLRNPIYNYSSGTGLGIRHQFNDNLELNLGYLAPDANDPDERAGLFNGKYGALAQVIVYPTDSIRVGFTYINAYAPSIFSAGTATPNPLILNFGTATGSNLSNESFGRPVVVNAYGISGTIDLTPGLAIGGWVGYAHHRIVGRGDATVWNWAASVSFPDLFGEGNTGGILVGMEPRVTEIDDTLNNGEADEDVSLHVEGFYRYRLSDNIDVTPGVIWLTAPNHDENNEDVVIGVVRTRFFF
jgi:BMFP domain-containing protein YqiC